MSPLPLHVHAHLFRVLGALECLEWMAAEAHVIAERAAPEVARKLEELRLRLACFAGYLAELRSGEVVS